MLLHDLSLSTASAFVFGTYHIKNRPLLGVRIHSSSSLCRLYSHDTQAEAMAHVNRKKKISKTKLKKLSKEENVREAIWSSFSNFYSQFYGNRWSNLLEELKQPTRYCALINQFADQAFVRNLLGVVSDGFIENNEENGVFSVLCDKIPGVVVRASTCSKEYNNNLLSPNSENNLLWPAPSSHLDPSGLYPYYPMDAASLIPVLCLNLKEAPKNAQIFDMCSAPGGKALGICMNLNLKENGGRLYCADISSERRARLKRAINNYMPQDLRDDHISVITGDGASNAFIYEFGFNRFDRILVDAPCSSERHLLQHESEMLKWGAGRSKINAKRQVALLLNALRLTKPGGRIVYSTCSLSPYENDDVVEKVISKTKKISTGHKGGSETKHVRTVSLTMSDIRVGGDKTKYGYHLLPDVSDSWGPIYVCALEVYEGPPDFEECINGESDSENSLFSEET